MKFTCKELNGKEFETKREMFLAIKQNIKLIVDAKKAAIKNSDPVSLSLRSLEAYKAEGDPEIIGIGSTVYPVINSCWWLDSHGDVHADGIWNVSAKDQNGKIYYIINHDLEIGKVIGYPEDVQVMVKTVTWKELGLDIDGETQILMFAVKLTEASNKDGLNAIIGRKPIQNSVRMQYISMTLCVDDDSDDFKQEKANFDKYVERIANKEEAYEQGFFWLQTEAKVYKEGSAVLFGSNSATPILYSNPSDDSLKTEIQTKEIDPTNVSQKLSNSLLLI